MIRQQYKQPLRGDIGTDIQPGFVGDTFTLQPLLAQLQALGMAQIDYVASLTHTEQHVAQLIDVLKPQGRLGVIDDPEASM